MLNCQPTGEAVLRASDGKWYISKSLKLATNDEQFLSIDNLRLFGEISKSFASVERSRRIDDKTEIYLSTVERSFQSGEYVRVVDSNNQDIYFKNSQILQRNFWCYNSSSGIFRFNIFTQS
jgi:hypothetical protein